MLDDEIPDNDWDTEVRQRALAGEDEETVRAEVIKRYLDVCDPRPLVSAIFKGRPISATTRRHIAAIFDPDPRVNEPVPTIFGISFLRGRGRGYLNSAQAKWVKFVQANLQALSEGSEPGPLFWPMLACCLRCGHPEHWISRPSEYPEHWIGRPGEDPVKVQYPAKLRLQFRAQKHRPTDPTLDMRNRAMRWFVDEAMKRGSTRGAAIEEVAKANNMSERTVKRAVYRD